MCFNNADFVYLEITRFFQITSRAHHPSAPHFIKTPLQYMHMLNHSLMLLDSSHTTHNMLKHVTTKCDLLYSLQSHSLKKIFFLFQQSQPALLPADCSLCKDSEASTLRGCAHMHAP